MKDPEIYGLMAEFDNAEAVVEAAHKTYAAGYRKIDAYSPFPIEELWEAIGFHNNGVAKVSLLGGLLGGTSAYLLQWWINTISYPVNIGGRPYHSWPAFIIVTFEMTILFGGLSAVFGMLTMNGLPQHYHPVFNVDRFAAVTRDKFFIVIFSSDAKYDAAETKQFLQSLRPTTVMEVPT